MREGVSLCVCVGGCVSLCVCRWVGECVECVCEGALCVCVLVSLSLSLSFLRVG